MKVSIIGGAGYVGLITGLGISTMGHDVIATDIDKDKIDLLRNGDPPIYEEGLKSLLDYCNQNKMIEFSEDTNLAIKNSDLIIISVGTPTDLNGNIDLSQVKAVLNDLITNMSPFTLIVIKSTLPITAVNMLKEELRETFKEGEDFEIVSNPEFLREGRAVYDFFNPDRIVLGANSSRSIDLLKNFYSPLINRNLLVPEDILVEEKEIPFVVTNLPSAQMIKYGSNAFLANKVSFVNEMAQICESVGADVKDVISGMGLDPRIGTNYMQPGPGFGGPCLEKDLEALIELGKSFELESTFMKAILDRNERQVDLIRDKIAKKINSSSANIAILGLAFKAGTDDIRNSASIKLINMLLKDGHSVRAYDPVAKFNINDNKYSQFGDVYLALESADCTIIMTEWEEFKSIDLNKLKDLMESNIIFDMRNILDKFSVESVGLNYIGLGS
ncbi:MAG: UDP-glucose/GDP-mannose dehydrogenase family protein [Chloroflexota bacterium]|nr:UDP-glucose/GDP-mannose dehydrogenase family protein [Chloroflexota bacterium]